ncbi:hypothetical protein ABTO78_21440, partial [Acinetobacter baumannii]
ALLPPFRQKPNLSLPAAWLPSSSSDAVAYQSSQGLRLHEVCEMRFSSAASFPALDKTENANGVDHG